MGEYSKGGGGGWVKEEGRGECNDALSMFHRRSSLFYYVANLTRSGPSPC
jgi:hypothetical protein